MNSSRDKIIIYTEIKKVSRGVCTISSAFREERLGSLHQSRNDGRYSAFFWKIWNRPNVKQTEQNIRRSLNFYYI